MKNWLMIALLIAVLISTAVAAQFPEVEVSADSIDDRILIEWSANAQITSSLEINDKILVFGPSAKFQHEELGLDPGKTYRYEITACNEGYCSTYKKSIQTQGASSEATVTGSTISELGTKMPIFYYVLVALIGLTMVFVYYRASQPDMRIRGLLDNSEKYIKKGKHEMAFPLYKKALDIYKNFNTPEKAMHYHRLMRVYNHLSLNQKQREAKELTEKYAKGTLTEQEMMRLRKLLTE